MHDKRPVDELSIEELERILAVRKREARMEHLKRMQRSGRVVAAPEKAPAPRPSRAASVVPALEQSLAPDAPVSNGSGPTPRSAPISRGGPAPQFEDDADDPRSPGRGRFWRSFVSQSLLLVEVVAVVGLIFLGYQLFRSISTLERETASAQALADEQRRATIPTLAPTPQLQLNQIVLPGGHTPPTAPGGAQFNFAEIPANLLPLVQDQITQPVLNRPPPTAETALQLTIPKLNVDQTIIQGTDWESLKLGIGQLPNGVNPGDENGNLVLAAHNDIYGEYFRHLDQLEEGDEFYIRTRTHLYTYRVTGWDIYEPTDVHVMDPRGGATATLISCYPYQVNTERIVVFAVRVGDSA